MCAVERPGTPPLLDEHPLGALHHRAGHDHRDRHRDQGHQGEHGRDPEHHPEHRDHGQHRGEQLAQGLLEGRADVVDVVGDAAQQLTAGLAVDVGERETVHLVLHVGAHPTHRALHHVVEDPPGQPAERGRADVDRQHEHEHVAHGGEVDALAGDDVHAADHVGDLVVAALAEQVDGLGLGQPVGQLAADQPGEDQVRGPAQHPRAERGGQHADDGEGDDRERLGAVRRHPGDHASGRRTEGARLLPDHAPAHRAAAGTAGTRLDALGLLERGGRLLRGVTHATSPTVSWDWTISR